MNEDVYTRKAVLELAARLQKRSHLVHTVFTPSIEAPEHAEVYVVKAVGGAEYTLRLPMRLPPLQRRNDDRRRGGEAVPGHTRQR
jgi:hypothetical protein